MDNKYVEAVRQLISNVLQIPVEQVSQDLAFGDCPEWDSMGHMEIMLALEERFGIEVNVETISTLTNVLLIVRYLEEYKNA